jgi:Tfp pilus assembly protein PilX
MDMVCDRREGFTWMVILLLRLAMVSLLSLVSLVLDVDRRRISLPM